MRLGALARESAPAPVSKLETTHAASGGLRVGKPDDAFEQEAERVADAVMAPGAMKQGWSLSRMSIEPPLQRKCACGGSGECEDCKKKEETLQRRPAGTATPSSVPPIVHDVLRSPGTALDSETRAFFEPRFGRDLSAVRIHADSRAAESARTVNALAYTVGNNIAMGTNQYTPRTEQGRRLLAHELVHVMQQSSPQASRGDRAIAGAPHIAGRAQAPVIARACLSKDVCKKKTERTPEQLLEEETSKPENKSKRDSRKAACTKKPQAPGCTADGHGARAVQTEKVLHDYDPSRLKAIKQIVVDKDMESNFAGLTGGCGDFMPPIKGGGLCTFIPEKLEKEAAQFNNTKDLVIGGSPRDIWRNQALMTLMHETEHARFDVTRIAAPRPGACKFNNIQDSLSEIAAMLAEFPIIFRGTRENVTITPQRGKEILDKWFTSIITNDSQSFKSTLHAIYCLCDCADAAAYVRKTIEFTTADWSRLEKTRFHSELQDPKWAAHDLRWPVAPPAGAGP